MATVGKAPFQHEVTQKVLTQSVIVISVFPIPCRIPWKDCSFNQGPKGLGQTQEKRGLSGSNPSFSHKNWVSKPQTGFELYMYLYVLPLPDRAPR